MATQIKPKSNSDKKGKQVIKTGKKIEAVAPKVKWKKQPEIDPQNLEAIKFLRSLQNATPAQVQEQKETWAFLKKALDEDRLSPDRPFFPEEDVTL